MQRRDFRKVSRREKSLKKRKREKRRRKIKVGREVLNKKRVAVCCLTHRLK
jgi:hypothetical protein